MSQLTLFDAPKATLSCHERLAQLAWAPETRQALLDVFNARPGEWLSPFDVHEVAKALGVGSWFGHVLSKMSRDRLLLEKKVYAGKGIDADKPGSPNYQGFYNMWMLAVSSGATATTTASAAGGNCASA